MKKYLIIINNFVHDLFTGMWVSALAAIFLLENKKSYLQGTAAEALRDIMKFFFALGIFSLAVVIITGIFRSVYYKQEENKNIAMVKKRALVFKHILLGSLFILGTWFAYIYAFN